MNSKAVIVSMILLVSLILGGIFLYSKSSNTTSKSLVNTGSPLVKRSVEQYPLNQNKTFAINASKVPEFLVNVSGEKYQNIVEATKETLHRLVEVSIVGQAQAANLDAVIAVDKTKKELMVSPKDVANFTPGLYKISIKMRTLEGTVDLDQDFAWGVIAVNTKKSVYQPGEAVDIGIGVLNDEGETQCLTGFDHVTDLTMEIVNPGNRTQKFSIKDTSIKDSGKCGSISVTNEADFQSTYTDTQEPGIYEMTVTANVKGNKRSIKDYFKVDPTATFDVERADFPTRIYPRSLYPVALKITSKKDYNGPITDIVPGFFQINVADGGKTQKDGSFTKIVWNVKLKAGISQTLSYFIKFPPISPEFYLIGPIKIGDFTEARQWQIASDAINSTSGLVSLEDNGSSNTWSRIWTGTTWSPALGSAPTSMATTPTDSRWFREVSSPKTGEKLVAILDNVNPDDLYVFHWSGTAWAQEIKVDLTVNTADTTRMIDIAYEEESGQALFIYSKGTGTGLFYRLRAAGTAGTWTGELTAATLSTFADWVRLKPEFNSDTILVGYLNNSNRVGALIWDGSTDTFGNQLSDASGTVTATVTEQAFDIAWETHSATPMIFWGTTGNNLVEREFSSGTWQAESIITGLTAFSNDLSWVYAASDPVDSSDNISLALQDSSTCRAHFAVWTGSSATVNGTVPTCASATTNNLVDTAFENNSDRAMFVYISSATTNQFSWLTWTSGGGFTSATTEAGTTTNIEGVELYADLNTTSMMLLYHDNSGASSACQLWDREWDGTSWSAKNASPVFAAMCASADNDTEPYGFGFDRNLEQQVAYRWFDNNNGTSVTTALTTQDTPYTLTSANQAFRLRMLLYTTDTLGISLRNYKLQYVDPGTGTCNDPTGGTPSTWTDVPTSGGQISFNNNATPADGNNLTANGSLDPTYLSKTVHAETYEEANNFTNTTAAIPADELGEWDFSLIDNTAFDRTAQSFCFRIARTSDVVLQIGVYPQISTASIDDVLIQGGTNINQGTSLNNP